MGLDIEYRLRLEGRVYVLPVGETFIGRDSDCLIQIADDLVSRHHARLTHSSEGLVFEDLESANGSQVNGEFVSGPVTLRAGDRLRIGLATMEVESSRRTQTMNPTLRLTLCPACGALMADEMSFCVQCGHRLPEARRRFCCRHCGTVLPPGEVHCVACDESVTGGEDPEDASQ